MNEEIKKVKNEIREVRAEMRAMGIKRTSCFNGGLDQLTYSFNARMFALETKRDEVVKRVSPKEVR